MLARLVACTSHMYVYKMAVIKFLSSILRCVCTLQIDGYGFPQESSTESFISTPQFDYSQGKQILVSFLISFSPHS